jgi:hypothetical protein
VYRRGKHTIDRLFSIWSVPRPLLCNSAVNTHNTILDNIIRCLPWGPCEVVTKKNSTEQHRVDSPVSRRQLGGSGIESSLWNWQLQNNGKKGIRL